ncbi:MAG TPA: hypothetical protein VKZ97_09090 [Flavobacteriaceae bacterium]|nr:hypothetical protein [Flavobacteriaceae bacterium]
MKENEANFRFNINGTEIIIKVEKGPMNQVIVPIYRSVDEEVISISSSTPEPGFVDDIKSLLPKVIDENYFSETMESLFNTIQNHLNRFGRLLPSDMELYVGEAILVMCGVSRALQIDEPGENEKPLIFNILCQRILNAMP